MKLILSILLLLLLSIEDNAQFCCAVFNPGVANDTINVQFWDSSRTAGKFIDPVWNNVAFTNGLHGSVHSSQNLFTTTGASTAVTVSLNNLNDFANNGTSYGIGNTMGYPAGAFQEVLFNTITPSSFFFNNVPTGISYRVEIISSSKTAGTYPNTFTSGSVTDNIDAFNNLSHTIILDNVTASGGVITIVNTFTGTFGVVNAMRLIIRH